MVAEPAHYPYSSHNAYIGSEPAGIVDVDPVLRHFGSKRKAAVRNYVEFMGTAGDDDESGYSTAENDVLGSEEFVDANIHRLGVSGEKRVGRASATRHRFVAKCLIDAVEDVFRTPKLDLYGPGKNSRSIMAKELVILIGRDAGAKVEELAKMTGLDPSSVSRRYDVARDRFRSDRKMSYAKALVEALYKEKAEESNV
jgi:hypothetical protein